MIFALTIDRAYLDDDADVAATDDDDVGNMSTCDISGQMMKVLKYANNK